LVQHLSGERDSCCDNNGRIFNSLRHNVWRSVIIPRIRILDTEEWYFAVAFVEAHKSLKADVVEGRSALAKRSEENTHDFPAVTKTMTTTKHLFNNDERLCCIGAKTAWLPSCF
jgi:cobalamin biosynthesis Co2+ chelatase CbiK